MVNARHLFYGLSMLKPFERMGKRKPYMIFSLTDETYSLLCGVSAPEGIDPDWFLFFISLLDQLYWIIGSCIGAAAGNFCRTMGKSKLQASRPARSLHHAGQSDRRWP